MMWRSSLRFFLASVWVSLKYLQVWLSLFNAVGPSRHLFLTNHWCSILIGFTISRKQDEMFCEKIAKQQERSMAYICFSELYWYFNGTNVICCNLIVHSRYSFWMFWNVRLQIWHLNCIALSLLLYEILILKRKYNEALLASTRTHFLINVCLLHIFWYISLALGVQLF